MNDFKSDEDLNKLDMQDMRFSRTRKSQNSPGINIPPQYLIIATTILVVLMLVIGISSTMKEPKGKEASSKSSITASDESSSSEHLSISNHDSEAGVVHHDEIQHDVAQDIHVPHIAPSPTEAVSGPESKDTSKRIELPGNISDVLSSQQHEIDSVSQKLMNESAIPTVQKTPSLEKKTEHRQQEKKTKNATLETSNRRVPGENEGILKKLPSSHFTLQLSSASRYDTLEAFAMQQKLNNYQVYETQRNHKPWFVLISGNYASSSAAKKAIATLPREVQEQKPWVKSLRQVHQQLKK